MKLTEQDLEEEPIDEEDDLKDEDLDKEDLDDDFLDDYYGEDGQPPIDKHKDLLKDLTNFDPYLKDTLNSWLGLTWDEEQEKYVKNPLIKATMKLTGASWCAGLLKTYARKNNIITNINLEEYKNIMSDHIDAVWLNLGTRDDFGIKEEGDLIRVANELEHAAALALMGAGDGKYNQFLGTTYSHHSTDNQGNPNRLPNMQLKTRSGFLERLKQKLTGL